eukprot:Nk52_evm25s1569 gene=Nk52_evmTU25s1569
MYGSVYSSSVSSLPPLLSYSRRQQMAAYRIQAMAKEEDIRAKKREECRSLKALLETYTREYRPPPKEEISQRRGALHPVGNAKNQEKSERGAEPEAEGRKEGGEEVEIKGGFDLETELSSKKTLKDQLQVLRKAVTSPTKADENQFTSFQRQPHPGSTSLSVNSNRSTRKHLREEEDEEEHTENGGLSSVASSSATVVLTTASQHSPSPRRSTTTNGTMSIVETSFISVSSVPLPTRRHDNEILLAGLRGFWTRLLWRSKYVCELKSAIKDITFELSSLRKDARNYDNSTSIDMERILEMDLQERLVTQLSKLKETLCDIFVNYSPEEQARYISRSRAAKSRPASVSSSSVLRESDKDHHWISEATKKRRAKKPL